MFDLVCRLSCEEFHLEDAKLIIDAVQLVHDSLDRWIFLSKLQSDSFDTTARHRHREKSDLGCFYMEDIRH